MLEVHVYNGFFGDERIDEVLEIRDVQIEQNIDSFDILSFKIDYAIDSFGNSNVKNIKDFARIKLVEVDNLEVTLFEGICISPKPRTNFMEVTARDFKGLLLRKHIFGDKSYTASTISGIMGAIV